MIVSIRAYLNHINTEKAVQDVQDQIIETRKETAFQEDFLIPYLASDQARVFAANENNRPLPGSHFIQFTKTKVYGETDTENVVEEGEITAQESWKIIFERIKVSNGW